MVKSPILQWTIVYTIYQKAPTFRAAPLGDLLEEAKEYYQYVSSSSILRRDSAYRAAIRLEDQGLCVIVPSDYFVRKLGEILRRIPKSSRTLGPLDRKLLEYVSNPEGFEDYIVILNISDPKAKEEIEKIVKEMERRINRKKTTLDRYVEFLERHTKYLEEK